MMSSETDRVKSGLTKFIRKVLNAFIIESIDHLACYPCKVISQNSDGTLELRPDDERLSTYSKVPIRYGIPGVRATVQQGATVLISWQSADLKKPYVSHWSLSGPGRSLVFEAQDINGNIRFNELTTEFDVQSSGSISFLLADDTSTFLINGADSRIQITGIVSTSYATGCSIFFPDGSKNINRAGDGVNATPALATWMSQVTAGLNGLAPGSVTPAAPSAIGVTTGGNPKVQA